ncbi:unnamed protein product [Protopolystoma xenopodis]|uniref:Uncharacterized protein n=1 Tax=Protopolystoma xenopodis TaxID=117903 RepID=A0A448WM18_9PLAT|nr:unnamed protein product [Protopolystoma xenopodis]
MAAELKASTVSMAQAPVHLIQQATVRDETIFKTRIDFDHSSQSGSSANHIVRPSPFSNESATTSSGEASYLAPKSVGATASSLAAALLQQPKTVLTNMTTAVGAGSPGGVFSKTIESVSHTFNDSDAHSYENHSKTRESNESVNHLEGHTEVNQR